MTPPIDLRIKHHFGADVYIRQMHVPKNHVADTHIHKYDHFGMLGSGSAIVEVDGKGMTHRGPCVILIEAGKRHKITALTDIIWFCVHGIDAAEMDIEKIDDVLIKRG